LRLALARRSERADGSLGVWGKGFRPPSLFVFGRRRAIFSRGYWEEINSESLAAQIHHLIRKRLYHLSRKIILA